MRFKINFFSGEEFSLPIHYNHLIQGFIYSHLDPILRVTLHEKGFPYEKRKFKLFTFSRIQGRIKKEGDKFLIGRNFSLIISSSRKEILQSLAENLLREEKIILQRKEILINSIDIYPEPEIKEEMIIKMLSPITVYSTLKKSNGDKKTYYYTPWEKEFSDLIKENLEKKYNLIHGEKFRSKKFEISPLRVNNRDLKVIKFKNTIIKGWMGLYRIKGEPELLKVGYDCGLGAKNSQGFGCLTLL